MNLSAIPSLLKVSVSAGLGLALAGAIALAATVGRDSSSPASVTAATPTPILEAPAAMAPDQKVRIAFVSDRDGSRQIYVLDEDGSNLKRLTSSPRGVTNFDWSPDGRQIAYLESSRDHGQDAYVIGAHGSGLRQIMDDAQIGGLEWSPDSLYFAFIWNGGAKVSPLPPPPTDSSDGSANLYVMNAYGSDIIQLTKGRFLNYSPAWSPDGRHIAYMWFGRGIFIIDTDGSNSRLLIGEVDDGHGQPYVGHAWSPDGTRIAFKHVAVPGTGSTDIYIMRSDGSSLTRIARFPHLVSSLTWSPNGEHLAAAVTGAGITQSIYLINVDGSGSTRLTDKQAIDTGPSWSPDGGRIAFTRRLLPRTKHASEPTDIYVVNMDGSTERLLVGGASSEDDPSWAPFSK